MRGTRSHRATEGAQTTALVAAQLVVGADRPCLVWPVLCRAGATASFLEHRPRARTFSGASAAGQWCGQPVPVPAAPARLGPFVFAVLLGAFGRVFVARGAAGPALGLAVRALLPVSGLCRRLGFWAVADEPPIKKSPRTNAAPFCF